MDCEKQGLEAHYELQEFDDTILFPTTVSEAKKGTPDSKAETSYLTDPYEMAGYSWYRKTITLPFSDLSDLEGKQFELTLERTRTSYVWVDGIFAGRFHLSVFSPSLDTTGGRT